MNSIFISIAGYRDPLLKKTLEDAMAQARHPDRLVFGVVDQSYDREFINIDQLAFNKQVRYLRIDPHMTRGCCFARNLSQSLWAGEQLYFQCDSHTLFDKDWDAIFEAEFFRLQAWHELPVITAYPRAFKCVDNKTDRLEKINIENHAMTLVVDEKFLFKEDYYLGTVCKLTKHTDTVSGYMISANCLFTAGQVCEDVPYDPYLFFHGEEHSLALRLWTSGYSIFHMPMTPVYHHYGRDYRTTMWGDAFLETQRNEAWWQSDKRSKSRLKYIVTGQRGGQYGVGSVRTINDYIRYCGINYYIREVEPRALTGEGIFDRDWRAPQHRRP